MTVPQSNFRVATPSGWFVFHDGTTYRTARMNGKSLYAAAQVAMRNSTELAGGGARSYDGSTVHGTEVGIDGDFGPTSYKALWAIFSARGANATVLTAISLGARAHTMNLAVLTMIADVALRAMGYSLPYEPHIPPNSLLPPYNTPMPGSISPTFAVSSATQEEIDASQGSVAPPQRTPTGPVAPGGSGSGAGAGGGSPVNPDASAGGGKDVTGGTGTPSDKTPASSGGGSGGGTTNLPSGGGSTVTAPASGISWGPIVATAAAVIVFGAIAYSLSRPSGPSRSAQVSHIRHAARARTRSGTRRITRRAA